MKNGAQPDLLEAIVAATREVVETRKARESMAALERRAARRAARGDRFAGALAASGRLNVIAECKRRSPSRGVLRTAYDPPAIASAYERAGAAPFLLDCSDRRAPDDGCPRTDRSQEADVACRPHAPR